MIRDPAFDMLRRSQALARALLLGRDSETQAAFARARIDVLFENAAFHGWRAPQPAIAWIPDFQHRFLRHLFSTASFWKRELGFRAQVLAGRTIMLSSEDSRRICERLYPKTVGRTYVVSFAVPAPPRHRGRPCSGNRGPTRASAALPLHAKSVLGNKNHALVLEALALLKARSRDDIVVAASGKTLDPRLPAHLPALKARVAELGLEQQFRILRLVPYDELAPLMRASDALLNPSLFEGWSTSVEEARSAGVPMLLSDLAVHREQAGDLARYFDPHSAESLAEALAATPPRSNVDELAVARAAQERVQAFADAFVAVVQSALAVREHPQKDVKESFN